MMGKIRILVVDDELIVRESLIGWLNKSGYDVVGAEGGRRALEMLIEQDYDLVFLDINMPKLSGLEFLRSLKHPPLVIITTAYAEFAIQGYELNVVDFLMKPFSMERFLKAVEKAEKLLRPQSRQTMKRSPAAGEEDQFIFVKSSKKTFRINLNDILYIEARGDYVKIYTTERMIVSYQSMKNLEAILSPKQFPRIHKSFIVSLARIDMIEGNQVKLKDRYIPIGTNFKAEFEKLIRTI